jgi:uncharacterized protein (DUF2147 family)
MKKIAFFAVVFVLVSGFCFAADPVEGFWISWDEKTGKATAGWEIYNTGGKLFGKILSLADKAQNIKADKCKDTYKDFPVAGKVNEMNVVGTPFIFGLTVDKQPGSWSGGNIIDPEDGKMYKCKITYRPADGKKFLVETLEMRGEIGLGIGRSQFWRRATQAEASGLR